MPVYTKANRSRRENINFGSDFLEYFNSDVKGKKRLFKDLGKQQKVYIYFNVEIIEVLQTLIFDRRLSAQEALIEIIASFKDENFYNSIFGQDSKLKYSEVKDWFYKNEDLIISFIRMAISKLEKETDQYPTVVVMRQNVPYLNTPEFVSFLKKLNLAGFVENGGGPNTHQSNAVRSFGAIDITGAGDEVIQIEEGDEVIMRARGKSGKAELIINPTVHERVQAYKEEDEQRAFQIYYRYIATLDGHLQQSKTYADAARHSDIFYFEAEGADGYALIRLESLFANYEAGRWIEFADDEMSELFYEFISAANHNYKNTDNVPVIFRIADNQQDKPAFVFEQFLAGVPEHERAQVKKDILENYSGVAFYFYEYEGKRPFYDFGVRQIKNLIKASAKAEKHIGITFPNMQENEIVSIEKVRVLIDDAKAQIVKELGKTEGEMRTVMSRIEFGFYVETTDAIDHIPDFYYHYPNSTIIEVGTNDLIQSIYTKFIKDFARNNPQYAEYFTNPKPPLLRNLCFIIMQAVKNGVPVIISGDIASSVRVGLFAEAASKYWGVPVHTVASINKAARQKTFKYYADIDKLMEIFLPVFQAVENKDENVDLIIQGALESIAEYERDLVKKITEENAKLLAENSLDKAVLSKDVGGIDMGDIMIDQKGSGINFAMDQAMLGKGMNSDMSGIKPVIISVTEFDSLGQLFVK
ncbi:MAG: hypothetical protein HQL25_05155 [Candidatus Omnitrophica bacterium]|nr:hypothetical protein [Candidatus Omnitrophota bacterium]